MDVKRGRDAADKCSLVHHKRQRHLDAGALQWPTCPVADPLPFWATSWEVQEDSKDDTAAAAVQLQDMQPGLSVSFRLESTPMCPVGLKDEDMQDTADSSCSSASTGTDDGLDSGKATPALSAAAAAAGDEDSITSGLPAAGGSSRPSAFSFGCRPSTVPDLSVLLQWDALNTLMALAQGAA